MRLTLESEPLYAEGDDSRKPWGSPILLISNHRRNNPNLPPDRHIAIINDRNWHHNIQRLHRHLVMFTHARANNHNLLRLPLRKFLNFISYQQTTQVTSVVLRCAVVEDKATAYLEQLVQEVGLCTVLNTGNKTLYVYAVGEVTQRLR